MQVVKTAEAEPAGGAGTLKLQVAHIPTNSVGMYAPPAGNPVHLVDTVTSTFNFSSEICSKKVPYCTGVLWHYRLVVKHGGILDSVNSSAGLGNL